MNFNYEYSSYVADIIGVPDKKKIYLAWLKIASQAPKCLVLFLRF
jgi:hypothetical protein